MPCYRVLLKFSTKRAFSALLIFSSITTIIFHARTTLYTAKRDFQSLIRPIFYNPHVNPPENLVAHFYSPLIPPRNACSLHHWTPRAVEKTPRVIDVFTFSIETDMLEIRMRELWKVVDTFVIVEADKTFTGNDKPLVYMENEERFAWASEKVVHFVVRELSNKPKDQWENEIKMRDTIASFIRGIKPRKGDLIIFGDIDELPSAHTIELIKNCEGYPKELHLELQNYLYSFEFRLQTKHWRPHVTIYDDSYVVHHQHKKDRSNYRLADAGWHCSFCFRYLSDFIFKMTSYSHSDRVTKEKLLERGEIQRKICDGSDLFDMFPEVYTLKDLISQLGKVGKTFSTIGIPQYVVENPERFAFLLPGGCLREDE